MSTRSVCLKAGLLSAPTRTFLIKDAIKCTLTSGRSRSMTTESDATDVKIIDAPFARPEPFAIRKAPTVLATIHSFPTLEPIKFEAYPSTFLHAPLRRDILHRAVIFEGDAHRLGRGKAKWRTEVHGSSKKIRPQKGSGRARLGDKKSPMLRGGGAAHGPKPRDFSTDLPKKMYSMAWRTALSYRYRQNELLVVENTLELEESDAGLVSTIIKKYGWGRSKQRSLFITNEHRPNLEDAMADLDAEARILVKEDVDVKDLLETGRIIIERDALEWFKQEHSSD
ncbi:ribosomal protein L4 domain-containing protein [Geopyxis carbonaria]|nr:ribosomal protein L4 domain-containing protein [Geopyxis carbonaria]